MSMATRSNGSKESQDDYNWSLLSHSYTHIPNRRGQSGYNSSTRCGGGNRRKGTGKWNTDTWRKENQFDPSDSPKRSSTSRFQASVSNDKAVFTREINEEDPLDLKADGQTKPKTAETVTLPNMGSIKAISHKQDVIDDNFMPYDEKDTWYNCEKEPEKSVSSRGVSSNYAGRGASGMYTKSRGNDRYKKRTVHTVRKPIDSEQARVLTEQLIAESYECMVCCECLRSSQATWCCQNCYHLFHLRCIKMWVKSCPASIDERLGNLCFIYLLGVIPYQIIKVMKPSLSE